MTKVSVFSIDGKKKEDIELPEVFNEEYRPDIIKRAFYAEYSGLFQPKGANPNAGLRTSAESWDTCGAMSRIPRVKAGPHRKGRKAKGHRYRSKGRWFPAAGKARMAPGAVGGREAHPPKSEKVLVKRLNKKEHVLALKSAIAATSNEELVKARGHMFGGKLPLVIEDSILSVKKTKNAVQFLNALGLSDELERTSAKTIRAGKGKFRGRRYREKKGVLFIIPEKTELHAIENISGLELATIPELNVMKLAPGANAGRLAIWTKSSLEKLKERFKP